VVPYPLELDTAAQLQTGHQVDLAKSSLRTRHRPCFPPAPSPRIPTSSGNDAGTSIHMSFNLKRHIKTCKLFIRHMNTFHKLNDIHMYNT